VVQNRIALPSLIVRCSFTREPLGRWFFSSMLRLLKTIHYSYQFCDELPGWQDSISSTPQPYTNESVDDSFRNFHVPSHEVWFRQEIPERMDIHTMEVIGVSKKGVAMVCFGLIAFDAFLWPRLSGSEGMNGVSASSRH
jgi:hypothetical protein